MKKLAPLAAALAFALLGALPAPAADHREAPAIDEDPSADINDVYVFMSPNDPSKVVFVMTVNPFTPPPQNLSFRFSPDVRYRFMVDTTGDPVADLSVDVTFGPLLPAPQQVHVRFPGGITVDGAVTLPTVQPNANPAVVLDGPQGLKVFAGERDDPFFFDLVGFNRFLAGGTFTKKDSFAGFNVSAIVLEFPLALLTTSSRPQLQIWGITERQTLTVRRDNGTTVQESVGPFRQIERMGNPGISTVLVPSTKKDRYNLGQPKDDARDYAPDFVARLKQLGTTDPNIAILASIAVPDTLKFDPSIPSKFPNGRAPADDVIDTLLFFIFNQPADPATASDGVPANDVPFLPAFPYLAPPHQP